MAKRLTDTEKWKDEWFVSLSNDDRIVWQWLLDNCSHAGFCKRSMSILNMMCRVNYSEDEMISKMERRVLIINNDWFIPKFIQFQYASLLVGKPAILSVVRELFQKNCIGIIPESFGNNYKIISKSFENHCEMIKDKVKDTVKVKDSLESKISKVSNRLPQKGEKFNSSKTGVFFPDGEFQELGKNQLFLAQHDELTPDKVTQGEIK